MPEPDILNEAATPPPPPSRRGNQRFRRLRNLSDRTSLRTKLITALLGLVIIAIAAISVASVVMLRSYVETRQDSDLKAAAGYYFNSPTFPDGSANLPTIFGPGGRQQIHPGTAYSSNSDVIWALQVPGKQVSWYNPPGPTTGNTQPTHQAPLPQLPTSKTWANSPNSVLLTVPAQSGPDSWRVIAQTQKYPLENGTQEKFTLVFAVDLGNINAMTMRLIMFDLIVGGAIVIVLAAVGAGVVRANLRPLDDIELIAGQIAAGHLDHRVPEGDPRTEVGSLGRSLNAMLSQIERAFRAQEASEQAAHQSEERMRRFIADASHELRTPLTTIRGFAAHYRQRGGANGTRSKVSVPEGLAPSSSRTGAAYSAGAGNSPGSPGAQGNDLPSGELTPEELDHLMGRVESEATRMGLLVEDLLTLARLDQQRPLAKAPVDVLSVAADAVQDARIVQPDRPISLSVAPGTAFLVDGDEARLRQVLGNLVNNALTHTPAGTAVRVKIGRGTMAADEGAGGAGADESRRDGERPDGEHAVSAVVLDVEDDGPGMSGDQAQRIFERFYRADAARNRASGGTGLGLAIVAGLVAAHGGTVSVRTAPGRGADFQVKLPLSPDALAAVDEADDDLPA
ncbi:sensor histidine kinase [Trebonia kvetii]|uniref:histidine kinase n=1 Tax=Trebonia kvetii TaxID=2480626 RepID=A0A6P2CAF6_9ACTN|nr:HAMP domain-containing sensor histidine kinase [Trebonia kvetii]TVZ06543.1 sensor histidine kinase [Trebonia kvetii]